MTASEIDITEVLLTPEDEAMMAELEETIETGLATFVAVGTALAEINVHRLYRATHATFAGYLSDRWDISESRGYQLIGAARVSTIVETTGMTPPARESQARALSGLNDPQVRRAWQSAVEQTGGKPTAKAVIEARQQVLPHTGIRRRRPLPDAFRSGVYDTGKQIKTLARLARDHRFDAHRDDLVRGVRGDLVRLIQDMEDVLDALDGAGAGSSSASVWRRPVHITVGANTASITVAPTMRHKVWETAKRLGVPYQNERRTKLIQVPAGSADDLQAALEMDGVIVELTRTAS